MKPKPIGLIMQGGGAFGAYEYGAVTCLLQHRFEPTVVSGVSIGAINTAVVAGARNGDIRVWARSSAIISIRCGRGSQKAPTRNEEDWAFSMGVPNQRLRK